MKFVSLDDGRVVYALNEHQLFIPGSAGKIYPAATALDALGVDHRFRTRVYRTGRIAGGVLEGDLVLVASGDPNLSGRLRPDGTLAFRDVDHSYVGLPGAIPVDGDPLAAIGKLADQVVARGIRTIRGRVVVDVSLFAQGSWPPGSTDIPISPIVVNDNLIDFKVEPGAAVGAPAKLTVAPATGYARFVNRVTTAAAGSPGQVQWRDSAHADGRRTVTVTGTVPVGGTIHRAYPVPDPRLFAETVLAEALRERGVRIVGAKIAGPSGPIEASDRIVAEHESAPLSETVKVALKVSQNLHSAMLPFLIGAIAAKEARQANAAGFGVERKLFEKAGLDLTAIAQSDGAGLNTRVSPDFTVGFLAHVARQSYFQAFFDALPVMGKDGSLADVQRSSPAAGWVRAKTGTDAKADLVNQAAMLEGKGLAGFIELPGGRKVAFGLYVNFVPARDFPGMMAVGEALGEIVSAVRESLVSAGEGR